MKKAWMRQTATAEHTPAFCCKKQQQLGQHVLLFSLMFLYHLCCRLELNQNKSNRRWPRNRDAQYMAVAICFNFVVITLFIATQNCCHNFRRHRSGTPICPEQCFGWTEAEKPRIVEESFLGSNLFLRKSYAHSLLTADSVVWNKASNCQMSW